MDRRKDMKDVLKESSGTSSTRLMFIIGLIWSMVVTTVLAFVMKWSAGEFIAVFTATSGIFVGLKLGQKPMEKK